MTYVCIYYNNILRKEIINIIILYLLCLVCANITLERGEYVTGARGVFGNKIYYAFCQNSGLRSAEERLQRRVALQTKRDYIVVVVIVVVVSCLVGEKQRVAYNRSFIRERILFV